MPVRVCLYQVTRRDRSSSTPTTGEASGDEPWGSFAGSVCPAALESACRTISGCTLPLRNSTASNVAAPPGVAALVFPACHRSSWASTPGPTETPPDIPSGGVSAKGSRARSLSPAQTNSSASLRHAQALTRFGASGALGACRPPAPSRAAGGSHPSTPPHRTR